MARKPNASLAPPSPARPAPAPGPVEHPLAPPRARVILVHDAAQPIGRALALHLSDRGHVVLAVSDDVAALADLPRETAQGGLIEIWSGRAGTRAARATQLFGRLDGLAVCHERWTFGALASQASPGATIDATLALVAEALPVLAARADARVALIAALPDHAFSAGALMERGALRGLAKALSAELDPSRVAVSLVVANIVRAAPAGPTHSDRLTQALTIVADDARRAALEAPARATLRALARGAPSAALFVQAAANALLTAKPKPVVAVKARRRLMGTRPSRTP